MIYLPTQTTGDFSADYSADFSRETAEVSVDVPRTSPIND